MVQTRPVADPIALVSVLSGAAVAISVPWITSTLERRRLREQVSEARVDELRAVLDLAAVTLDQAVSALPRWEVLLQDERGSLAAVYGDSRKALEAVSAQAERLAIRVGEASPVFTSYDAARNVLWKLHHELIAAEALSKIEALSEIKQEAETLKRLNPATNAQFLEARRTFRNSARAMVEPRSSRRRP